jgi:hypothetical protein
MQEIPPSTRMPAACFKVPPSHPATLGDIGCTMEFTHRDGFWQSQIRFVLQIF